MTKVFTNDETLPAGTQQDAIIAKVSKLMEGVPTEKQFSAIPAEGFAANRETIIRVHSADEDGDKPLSLTVFQLPSLQEILEAASGKDWLASIARGALLRKASGTLNRFLTDGGEFEFPVSVDDFTTSIRRSGGTGAKRFDKRHWNATKSSLAKRIREKSGNTMRITADVLESVLESQATAAAFFPSTPDDLWINLLNLLISMEGQTLLDRSGDPVSDDDGNTETVDVSVYRHWLATRDAKAFESGEAVEFNAADLF